MAIAYNITNKNDKVYITVFEETVSTLYYTSDRVLKVETKTLLPDIEYALPLTIDGAYRLNLAEDLEEDTIYTFFVNTNLENSIIKDIYSLFYKSSKTIDCNSCINKDAEGALMHRSILDKLLVYQTTYVLKYSNTFRETFYTYIENTYTNSTCSIQSKINSIISSECITGTSKISNLLNIYLGVYWSAMYFTAKKLAGEDEEQLIFVDTKFKYPYIMDYFCSLDLKPIEELELQFLENINAANTAPTVSPFVIRLTSASGVVNDVWTYIFTSLEFVTNFTDAESDGVGRVIITSLPIKGTLTLSGGAPIEIGTAYTTAQLVGAKYTVLINEISSNFDTFNFRVSDDNVNPLYSDMSTITMNTLAYQNRPISQAGDLVVVLPNRGSHTYTIANLTTELTPPYLDPDGDVLNAIRINSLPATGVLLFDNIPVIVGQVILATDIANGRFKFNSPDVTNVQNNMFSISHRDEGSMIWVPA